MDVAVNALARSPSSLSVYQRMARASHLESRASMTATAHQTAGVPSRVSTEPEAGRSDKSSIVVGTRGSALALWQTRYVLDRLRARHPQLAAAIEEITTRGDR